MDNFDLKKYLSNNPLLKENQESIPEDIQSYFKEMLEDFTSGNDNEYGPGRKISFKYEKIDKGDRDNYDDEDVDMFDKVSSYLKTNGPVTFHDKIDYIFSNQGGDIKVNWVEPDWDEINSKKLTEYPYKKISNILYKFELILKNQKIEGYGCVWIHLNTGDKYLNIHDNNKDYFQYDNEVKEYPRIGDKYKKLFYDNNIKFQIESVPDKYGIRLFLDYNQPNLKIK
jgi:hypothetical protein